MSNFVSNANATDLMEAIGTKKLTVTDVMPIASADNIGIPYLYLGATTQDFVNGNIYKCQEVTPATDPKTYEFVEVYDSIVDLSKYKRIWGGTEAAWDLLTDEEKAQYEYQFFEGDSADYFAVVDAVTDGDMHPVTANAVYDFVHGFVDYSETEHPIGKWIDGKTIYEKTCIKKWGVDQITDGTQTALSFEDMLPTIDTIISITGECQQLAINSAWRTAAQMYFIRSNGTTIYANCSIFNDKDCVVTYRYTKA